MLLFQHISSCFKCILCPVYNEIFIFALCVNLLTHKKTKLCLNPSVLLCDCIQRPSYFQPRQIGKFVVIQNHVDQDVLSTMDTTFTLLWCHDLLGCSRQSDKHCVTRAWLRNNKREWGRFLTPLHIGCALLKKNRERVSWQGNTCWQEGAVTDTLPGLTRPRLIDMRQKHEAFLKQSH